MTYIAITQPTAAWLLTRPTLIEKLHNIFKDSKELSGLKKGDLVEGSFRLAGSAEGRLLAIWNVDYLTGTGNEEWGFIKLEGSFGLLEQPLFSKEVFERCLYVINQRLQNLLLDSAFFHREQPNGAHTCLAGRGTQARQYSIGYVETDVALETVGTGHGTRTRSVLCVGPSDRFIPLTNAAVTEARTLPSLVKLANEISEPGRRRPLLDSMQFAEIRSEISPRLESEAESDITVAALKYLPSAIDVYNTLSWNYEQWVANDSPLSQAQRRVLESDGILRHPMRIIGPAGSGKTLLMQLLALRRVAVARERGDSVKVIYIVHNAPMAQTLKERFATLAVGSFAKGALEDLRITTLSDYGKEELQIDYMGLIDNDAHATKVFQLQEVERALRETLHESKETVAKSKLLKQLIERQDLFEVFARLTMAEISTAIKGHGLVGDRERYIGSERRISRLHGIMDQQERGVVFDTFQRYHQAVFEEQEVLDSDDVALSLLGKMRTPIWDLKRKTIGYDFVFVDETQLFNENERRIFHLLARGTAGHVPIVLALDEAQEVYGQTSAGFGALGIGDIENENLPSNFRSTRAIVDLAFFVIQRTVDLFGPDFPNFTGAVATIVKDDHPLAVEPSIELCKAPGVTLAEFAVSRVLEMRKKQLKQIAIVCHAETYWEPVKKALEDSQLHPHILLQRGNRLPNHPLVVLTRPAYVGGQEFDGVIAVGLEQGLIPPRVQNNDALAAALEQQAFREMYLSFTRARYQLKIVVKHGGRPTRVLQDAAAAGVVARREI